MKKILFIGWKDVTLAFRDRAALILMLVAPFALTLGMGFITGRMSGGSDTGLSNIPVVLVNEDGGQLGNALVGLFRSPDLAGLVAPSEVADPVPARQQVDADKATVAVIIPMGFTDSIIPARGSGPEKHGIFDKTGEPVQIILYSNPTRPTGAGVVRTIVEEFASQAEAGRVAGQVAATELLSHGLAQLQDAERIGREVGIQQANAARRGTSIILKNTTAGGAAVQFDMLAYLAPGMALMFLMFTTSNGGRTLLTERAQGTLPRLLISPTTSTQVLGGKTTGVYLTGVAQMLILIVTSALLFRLRWGDPVAVLVLILAAVAGATGWGMLITAVARTPGQASSIGSAVTLIFGVLGGAFISLDNMPPWYQAISKITPNAWGLEGFTTLALGGGLADILLPVVALLTMGAVLFPVAVLLFRRRGIATG
jgi:ABC-2 type transport system permease protein